MFDSETFYSHRWELTPLGPVDGWSRQLRYMCDLLLSSKQAMFLLWGSERAFIFNAAYQEMWNGDPHSTLGQPIEQVTGEAWPQLESHVERVFKGESFCENDFPLVNAHPSGVRYFDFSYTPITAFDSPQQIVAALCITGDATERVVSTQRNRDEREILALTVDNVTEGVALVESDLSLVLWNEPFRVHFGYEEGEIQAGMNAMELMLKTARRGDLGPGDPAAIVESLAHGIMTTESGRLEIQRGNGKVLSLYRRRLGGGRFLLVSQDVTDERLAARLKDELVSTVSHELRTPLTAISGALSMVSAGAAGQLPDKAEQLVRIAQRNSERLIVLVNDLLDIGKLQSGKAEFNLEALRLNELVCVAVEQNQPLAEQASVLLVGDVPDTPVWVDGDRNRLLQVLANLISNAVKFSPPRQQVLVRLRLCDGRARISLIDQGPGVAEAFRPRLFDHFTQQDGTASRVQQGTGLGLAISRGIVEGHGGSIHLDTTTAAGATFHVDLPLSRIGGMSGEKGERAIR